MKNDIGNHLTLVIVSQPVNELGCAAIWFIQEFKLFKVFYILILTTERFKITQYLENIIQRPTIVLQVIQCTNI